MIDDAFCITLEYAISRTFATSTLPVWKSCFCDGVPGPDGEAGIALQNDYGVMRVWIDKGELKENKSSQFLYDTKLYFGVQSIEQ